MQYSSSDFELSKLIQQQSPDQAAASFHLLAAAASSSVALGNGSPKNSDSYGNLSIAAANAAATSTAEHLQPNCKQTATTSLAKPRKHEERGDN